MAGKNVPISFIFQGIDNLTAPLRKVNKELAAIQAPVKKFQGQLSSFTKLSGMADLGKAIGGVGNALGDVVKTAAGTGLALFGAAYAAKTAFDELIGSTIKENGALAEHAKKTGLSVEQLQLWQYAAEQSGVSVDALDTGLVKFSKNLSEARRGKGTLVEMFGEDSAFLSKLKGIKDTDKAFQFLLQTVDKIPNEQDKFGVLQAAAGRGSAEFINLAEAAGKTGRGSLQNLFEIRAKMKLLNKEQADSYDSVNDKFDSIGTQFKVLKTQFVAPLLPEIQKMADAFSDWVIAIQPDVIAKAKDIAKELPEVFKRVKNTLAELTDLWERWSPKIGEVYDRIGGLKGVLTIFAAVIFGPLISSIFGLIASLVTLGVVLTTTPFGLVTLAVASFLAGMYALYNIVPMIGDAINNAFSSIGKWITETIPGGEYLVTVFSKLLEVFKFIFKYLTPMGWALRIGTGIGGLVDSGIKSVTQPFSDLGTKALSGVDIAGNATGPDIANAKSQKEKSEITVNFKDVPRGTTFKNVQSQNDHDLNLAIGYAFGGDL